MFHNILLLFFVGAMGLVNPTLCMENTVIDASKEENKRALAIFKGLPGEVRCYIRFLMLQLKLHEMGSRSSFDELCTFKKFPITSLVYSPSEATFIASSTENKRVYLVDVKTGEVIEDRRLDKCCLKAVYSNEQEAFLGLKGGSVVSWSFKKGLKQVIEEELAPATTKVMAFTSDKKTILIGLDFSLCSTLPNTIYFCGMVDAIKKVVFFDEGKLSVVTSSFDGKSIIMGSQEGMVYIEHFKEEENPPLALDVLLLNFPDKGIRVSLKGHGQCISSAVFNKDGRKVLTASWDQTACLWDAGTGALEKRFNEEGFSLYNKESLSTAVFGDLLEQTIITATYNGTVRLLDSKTRAIVDEFCIENKMIDCLALTEDCSTLLIGCRDGSVYKAFILKDFYKAVKGKFISPTFLLSDFFKAFCYLYLNPL